MFFTQKRMNQLVSSVLAIVFSFSMICPPDIARAQVLPALNLPGEMLAVSSGFVPVMIKGMTPDPVNPLGFDFIIDTGHTGLEGDALKDEAQKLIKYFLVSLTVPEEDLWVNLSPYEKDRIIPKDFGSTEMGRDLLAQDYILKQLTASFMYPEQELGQGFWKSIYSKVEQKTGGAQVPLNSFHKVWIVPDEAVVYEHKGTVYVVKSHLKVMLEEDYLALQKTLGEQASSIQAPEKIEGEGATFTQALREILIPEIEREVNEGKHFANLRQVYNSMILAAWYKANLRQTLLGQVYVNQAKVKGIDLKDPVVNEQIYKQYLEAFKKGAYDYIKEEYDQDSGQVIPRRYFSGGTSAISLFKAFAGQETQGMKVEVIKDRADGLPATNAAVLRNGLKEQGTTFKVSMQLVENADDSIETGTNAAVLSSTGEDLRDWMAETFNHNFIMASTTPSDWRLRSPAFEQRVREALEAYRQNVRRLVNMQIGDPVALGLSAEQKEQAVEQFVGAVTFAGEIKGESYTIRSVAVASRIEAAIADVFPAREAVMEANAAVLSRAANDLKDWMVSSFDQKVVIQSRRPADWNIRAERFGERVTKAQRQYRESVRLQVEAQIVASAVLRSIPQEEQGQLVEGFLGTVSFFEQTTETTYAVRSSISLQRADAAITSLLANAVPATNAAVIPGENRVGGIDLNPANLNLQIKRDGDGIPLPLPQQPIGDMNIDGFYPVIINVLPIQGIPALLGMDTTDSDKNTQNQSAELMSPFDKMDRSSVELDWLEKVKS